MIFFLGWMRARTLKFHKALAKTPAKIALSAPLPPRALIANSRPDYQTPDKTALRHVAISKAAAISYHLACCCFGADAAATFYLRVYVREITKPFMACALGWPLEIAHVRGHVEQDT